MHEIISIHVGQAGLQFGNACWELYCLEHGIGPDGCVATSASGTGDSDINNSFDRLFQLTEAGQHVPRSIMIDLEPTVVDEIRTGTYGKLHKRDRMISGPEDAANNFARAKYTLGRPIIESIMEQVQKAVDECESIEGFMLFHSLGGGTGSGLMTFLLEKLCEYFPKKAKVQLSIYPSPTYSCAMVEPYNAVLTAHETMETTDLSLMIDNESMYDIMRRCLFSDVPNYSQINRVIAQVISTMTSPIRFDGPLRASLQDFQTNLVPYPRIHFPLITYAPFQPVESFEHEIHTVQKMTKSCFEASNRMLQVDPRLGKYIAVSTIYRGNVHAREVNDAINEMKSSRLCNFVDWCPTGFKVGINFSPPTTVPGSLVKCCDKAVCMLSNNSALVNSFYDLTRKFKKMYEKRCFVHWYVAEGMEEGEMLESIRGIEQLQDDYIEITD